MDFTIYAIRGGINWYEDDWYKPVQWLKNGEGFFGWSYVDTADLYKLKSRVESKGWGSLSDKEKNCYYPFLLDLKENDYVVYVNLPKWGQCTVVRVTSGYYWDGSYEDFNHRFKVDPSSMHTFDRNDDVVHPALNRRLKLQGPWWRIKNKSAFEELLLHLKDGTLKDKKLDSSSRLVKEMQPYLLGITQKIQHTHPAHKLQDLFEAVFNNIPGVINVENKYSYDYGADLLVTYQSGLPFPEAEQEDVMVVQIKSYVDEHWETNAVNDIKRAFEHYPDATMGLIISTADTSTPALDDAIRSLREDSGKKVELLIGEDVAALLLRYSVALKITQ